MPLNLFSTKCKCPTCKVGKLVAYRLFLNGALEMLKEIRQPWLFVPRVYYKLKLRHFDRMPDIYPQYECEVCKAMAVICPNCSKPWAIAKPLEHLQRVICPKCRKEFFFNMG